MRAILACILYVVAIYFFSATGLQAGSFDGKTITYIISTKPGGGYDAYGRLVAKYLQKHLPGSTVVPKNLPGAGHRLAFETLAASEPDGLTIGTFNTNLVYGQIAGMFGQQADMSKLSWIGKAGADSRVMLVSAKSTYKSIDDLRKTERYLKVGVNGKGSSGHFETALLAKLLGLKLQPIFAFEGDESALSIMRGELDLTVGSRSSLQRFVDSGDGRFVLGFGAVAETDIPQLEDVVASEVDQSLIRLMESQGRYMRVTAAPPGMPAALLAELRQAYDAALVDPDLLAEAKAQKLPIVPASGEEVGKVIAASLQQSPEIVEEVKRLLKEGE